MTNLNLQHWKLSTDAEGIAWAVLDKAGESANSLSSTVMTELGQLLDALDRQPPKALIFRSGKDAGFIAGADIQEFTQLDTAEKGRNWSSAAGTCLTGWRRCRTQRWPWCVGTALAVVSNWRWLAAICWRSTSPEPRWGCRK